MSSYLPNPDSGQPQWGGRPPQGAGEGQFTGPPPWGPPPQQPQWDGPPPGPPPQKGGKGKWVLGGVIVLLVVALSVTVTILVTRDGSSGSSPTEPGDGQASEFASANDIGPVNIITEDPTCDAWGNVARELGRVIEHSGWERRDKSIPATDWNTEIRGTYDAMGKALTSAADDAVKLSFQTPHRVMRELYEQFAAYAKSFSASIPRYNSADDSLSTVVTESGNSVSNICGAINSQSASAVEPLLKQSERPTAVAPAKLNANEQFMRTPNSVCAEWEHAAMKFDADTAEWRALNPNIDASDWSPKERTINENAIPVMNKNAENLEALGRHSGNSVLEDFAVLASQYRRGFAQGIPSYTVSDNYLAETASNLVKTVSFACEASH
ncbi:hypothetical protein [Mycobacterium sp. GA-2829]|uniref:hypothetical protein n=1 Tax=Mycobacterium sp. GA-2829 TaxID=1772283 RepID=UPI000A4668D7|nr:hypothetical protein [Mycobacterium sp. GA-2829]